MLLALGSVLALVYHPVLTRHYAMADDYPYLWVVTTGELGYFHWLSAMGRPLYEWISVVLYQAMATTGQLGWIRALTLLGTVLFAGQIALAARRTGWSSLEVFCLAVLVTTSAAFGVYLAWSVCFNVPYAASAGFLAAGLALRAESWSRIGHRVAARTTAVVLLMIGLMLYQPAAMAYWLYPALMLFAPRPVVPGWSVMLRLLGLFGLALGLYWLLHRWQLQSLLTLDPGLGAPAGRGRLSVDPLAKLVVLIESLGLAASVGRFVPAWPVAAMVAGLALVGVRAAWRHSGDDRVPLYALALLPLGYLPNLLVEQNAVPVRVVGILSAL
ncbi:MAG: hypothetical protein R3202_07395, partial [Candidatus Competibacterales bacterium]|nr:hypothetical protein [Candidatus Competibacterales bacterium]